MGLRKKLRQTRCILRLIWFALLTAAAAGSAGCRQRVVWEQTVSATEAVQNHSETAGDPDRRTAEAAEKEQISVHVCGAVVLPGVYHLPAGARLIDAVTAAGGFASDADTEWCNQASLVQDQEQIRILTKEETCRMENSGQKPEGMVQADSAASSGETEKINLNTAPAGALQSLPGIGAGRAEAIIAYREEHGGFASIEEIMKISGIKEALFGKIKDRITV